MNTNELTMDTSLSNLHVLIIGRQGSGKTYQIHTWPKPRLVADFDGKIEVLRGHDVEYDTFILNHPRTSALFDSFGVKQHDNRGLLSLFGLWLTKHVNRCAELGSGTIVVDTLTSFSSVLMNAIREENNHLPSQTNPYTGRMRGAIRGQQPTGSSPTQEEYGIFNQKMREILSQWRTIPCCFILNAHARYMVNDQGTPTAITPETEGQKIAERIGDMFSEIWWAGTRKKASGLSYFFSPTYGLAPTRTSLNLPDDFPQNYEWVKSYVGAVGAVKGGVIDVMA